MRAFVREKKGGSVVKNFIKTLIEILESRVDKKIILLILIIVVFSLSMGGSWAKEPLFSDVPANHWAHDSILKMQATGIIAGYPDGSFKPGKDVTYGEFIKMLAVATDVARPTEAGNGKHWALPFYHACLNNFHFSEWDISEKQFDIAIPRKDMALAVSGALGRDVKIADYGDYGRLMETINDIDKRHSHEFHIIKAYATGILTGYPDGSFRPDGVLNRAEAASVIRRLGELLREINGPIAGDKDSDPAAEGGDEGGSSAGQKSPGPEAPEEKPLVDKRIDPLGYPKGSVLHIIFNYHDNTEAKHMELRRLLIQEYPHYGEAMFASFERFMAKPISIGGVGLRKEYFGELPVFMEHMSNSATFTIFPIGYDDPYWGIKPGQVEEYIR